MKTPMNVACTVLGLLALVGMVCRYRVQFGGASDLIARDRDGFAAKLTAQDLHARRVKDGATYARRSAQALVDFTGAQRLRLCFATLIADLYMLVALSPKLAAMPWRLQRITSAYEQGFPHTRGRHIFMHARELRCLRGLIRTLVHEKVHVYQRIHAASVQAAYERMGYTRAVLRSSVRRARSNPDLDDWIWRDPNGRLMVATYTTDAPASIMDVKVRPENRAPYEHPNEYFAYSPSRLLFHLPSRVSPASQST